MAASNMLLMSEAKGMLKREVSYEISGYTFILFIWVFIFHTFYLGIHFQQGDGFVKMNQKGYITKERLEMSNCKPRSTPSEQKLEFDGETPVDPRPYREAVGSLMYALTCTRPARHMPGLLLSCHSS